MLNIDFLRTKQYSIIIICILCMFYVSLIKIEILFSWILVYYIYSLRTIVMRKPFKPRLMPEAEDEAKLIATYLCEFADSETVAANSLAMHEARVAASHLCTFKIYHNRKALMLMYQQKKARLDQLKEIRKYLRYS